MTKIRQLVTRKYLGNLLFFVVANQTYNLQIIEEQAFRTSIYQTFTPPISPQNYTWTTKKASIKYDSGENSLVHPICNVLKKLLASNQSGIVIKYLVQLKFIYYYRSWNKNIFQDLCKCGIIGKWKIRCVFGNGQYLGNFEELLCQGMLFVQKLEPVFAPRFWQQIFLS